MEKIILTDDQKFIINYRYPKYADLLIRVIERRVEKGDKTLDDMIDFAFIFIEEKSFHAQDFEESIDDSSDEYSKEE
jgi:hypothetical protein